MKKPHLVLMGGDGDIRLWGRCSSCEKITFEPEMEPMNRQQQEERLKGLFIKHFNEVHRAEDASQPLRKS